MSKFEKGWSLPVPIVFDAPERSNFADSGRPCFGLQVCLTNCSGLTELSVIMIAHNCPRVHEIELQDIRGLTDEAMVQIWLHQSYLREIQLSWNARLTDASFPLIRGSTELESLVSQEVQDRLNRQLDSNGSAILRTSPVTSSFSRLRRVDMPGLSEITDVAIEALISNAPRIRNLNLAKCSKVTDLGLESISRLGRHLHYINFGHVTQ